MIPRFIRQMGMSKSDGPQMRCRVRIHAGQCLHTLVLTLALTPPLGGQTASTGVLMGVTLDPSGAVLGGVTVRLNRQNVELQSVTSDQNGRFGFRLLLSGTYEIRADKSNFKPLDIPKVNVHVTETLRVELRLELAARLEQTQVSATSVMLQLDSSGLGRTVDQRMVSELPLVTRNYTQIAGLSPGVTAAVYNAGELGTGGTA
jgi:Carboxypeptidase regulatory-like domain